LLLSGALALLVPGTTTLPAAAAAMAKLFKTSLLPWGLEDGWFCLLSVMM
jgi:hypothetical protein